MTGEQLINITFPSKYLLSIKTDQYEYIYKLTQTDNYDTWFNDDIPIIYIGEILEFKLIDSNIIIATDNGHNIIFIDSILNSYKHILLIEKIRINNFLNSTY